MPTLPEVFLHGLKRHQAGLVEEAEQAYRWVLERDPRGLTARIMLASLSPVIYRSLEELHAWRDRTRGELQKLVDAGLAMDLTREWAPPNFHGAYHGYDERPDQELRARLFRAPTDLPPLPARSTSANRIRVGFCSAYFKDHTIGRLNLGLVRHLDRSRFEVTVVAAGVNRDVMAQQFRSAADRYVELPGTPAESRKAIRSLDLDVLLYADIGMNPITYSHGFSRLARVQCVTWGHPVTTGIPAIDHYISSEHLDLADGQKSYTENLVRLPDLAVCYEPPPVPQKILTRAQFGLPASGAVFGCLQSLFKLHPSLDRLLGEILRRAPGSSLLLLAGPYPHWEQILRGRFEKAIPDVADRIHFAPRQDRDGFLALNQLCDVMLDPLHFGGGNTSYEALAMNIPVVTVPSPFLRGRITHALYQAMGWTELSAADEEGYVSIASRLGTDLSYRQSAIQQIEARKERILNRVEGVRQFESFLSRVLTEPRP